MERNYMNDAQSLKVLKSGPLAGMKTDSTADLAKVVEILNHYGIRILAQEEIAEQVTLYPQPVAPRSVK
jgi:hypothetical protein